MQTPASRPPAALFVFVTLLALMTDIATARAEDAAEPTLALFPTVDELWMNLVVDEAALEGGAGYCQYTWTQGDQSGTHRIDFEAVWDVYDLGGICVARGSVMDGLSWPAAVAMAAELVIDGNSLPVTAVSFDPAASGLADPTALREALAAQGFEITVGEASSSFGTSMYHEWTVTDAAGEAWVSTYTATPDHLPAAASCDPGPRGIAECTICQATFCANLPLDSDTARRLQAALSALMAPPDTQPTAPDEATTEEPAQPEQPAADEPSQSDDGCDPACHPLFEVCYQGTCRLLE